MKKIIMHLEIRLHGNFHSRNNMPLYHAIFTLLPMETAQLSAYNIVIVATFLC
jgi:hypothetical protein